ncbi:hypothetical protein UlMin_044826 [Ulmus minor]
MAFEDDDSTSMVSSVKTNVGAIETSDSNDNNYAIHARKRPKITQNDTNNNDIASSSYGKFKGVVPQQNGHWGAQIYANHQRIWLGTFKSEKAAAMAYDSAAIKLRNGETHRNFPWTNLTLQEPHFQNHYSTEAILDMIKDGSYSSKFQDFLTTSRSSNSPKEVGTSSSNPETIRVHGNSQLLCRQLFQKELTPSDVGKLNRLVIPKKYAVKYFPHISYENTNNEVEDIELVFYDKLMRSWKFRYCYWRSSQSFVFTRGWNRFVKENSLKANDVITFFSCEENNGESFCLIEVTHNEGLNSVQSDCRLLKVDLGENRTYKCKEEEQVSKKIRLFGVDIK